MNQLLTRMKVADYSKLPVRIGQVIDLDGKEIVIFRLTNGNVYAIENISPHPKGGTLADGLVSGEFVYCPMHDWKISLVDGKVQAPDDGQVKIYPIEISDDNVYVLYKA